MRNVVNHQCYPVELKGHCYNNRSERELLMSVYVVLLVVRWNYRTFRGCQQ